MKRISSKHEGIVAAGAAMLVLFTNIMNPMVSFILALVALLGFAVYKLFQKQ